MSCWLEYSPEYLRDFAYYLIDLSCEYDREENLFMADLCFVRYTEVINAYFNALSKGKKFQDGQTGEDENALSELSKVQNETFRARETGTATIEHNSMIVENEPSSGGVADILTSAFEEESCLWKPSYLSKLTKRVDEESFHYGARHNARRSRCRPMGIYVFKRDKIRASAGPDIVTLFLMFIETLCAKHKYISHERFQWVAQSISHISL